MKIHIYIIIFLLSIFHQIDTWATTTDNTSPVITTSSTVAPPPPCAGENATLRWLRYDNAPGHNIESLYEHPFFPQAPTGYKIINQLQTPMNYTEEYGSLVRGYLVPPETGNYQFNVTGDDNTAFFLSTTEFLEDTVEICFVHYAWIDDHDRDGETRQTSEVLSLTAGEYYYFELHHKEGGGGDHAQVYWKTPFTDPNTWNIVAGAYLYDYTCDNLCDVRGTSCDDGDPSTINDTADGFCNCAGETQTPNECVGDRGSIMALYFDNIDGYQVSDLTSATSFMNNTPDRAEPLSRMTGPENEPNADSYGSVVRGFISPPTTGTYSFNVRSDDQSQFFLSSDDNPANLVSVAFAPGYTYEHDTYPEQTSADITLTKGEYYYFELLHKEGGGGDFFALHWKAPFLPTDKWTTLTPYYLYAYDCEMACIPDGTACNDGNDGTENDVFTNCDCAGTPCPNNDCATVTGGDYDSYDYCAPTDDHSNNEKDTWLSCNTSPNPNVTRGNTHWIQYNFGELKTITTSHVWNYNVNNETGKGFRSVVIDYSMEENPTSWTHFGTYEWQEAPGTNGYGGFVGPDFGGLVAQHILITGLTNWEGTECRGLSEMTFTVEDASLPLQLLSFNAVPEKEAIHLFWEVSEEQNLKGYSLQRSEDERNFRPMAWIDSEKQAYNQYKYIDDQVRPNQWYYYRLKMVEEDNRISYSEVKAARLNANGTMVVYPNPSPGDMNILITTPHAETVMIEVFTTSGQQIRQLQVDVQEGLTQQAIDLKGLPAGTYWVKVYGQLLNMTERVVIF